MAVDTRQELHRLVDLMPSEDLDRARQLLEALLNDDPVGVSLALAPLDDEPETEEERAAVAEAEADLAAGRVVRHEDIRREFGL